MLRKAPRCIKATLDTQEREISDKIQDLKGLHKVFDGLRCEFSPLGFGHISTHVFDRMHFHHHVLQFLYTLVCTLIRPFCSIHGRFQLHQFSLYFRCLGAEAILQSQVVRYCVRIDTVPFACFERFLQSLDTYFLYLRASDLAQMRPTTFRLLGRNPKLTSKLISLLPAFPTRFRFPV